MRLRAVGSGLWALGVLSFASGGTPKAQSPEPRAISITQFAFVPPELTVGRGDTVEWRNEDPFVHTIAADSGAWSSPEIGHGQRFVMVAKQTGRFGYHCSAHPVMRGVLVVQ